MNRVNDSTSKPKRCTVFVGSLGSTTLSSGPGTVADFDTSRPLRMISTGCSGLAIPISLM